MTARSSGTDLDVAVVGAGIAGLTAAHELVRAGLHVRVLEQHGHVGGRMHSHRHAGYTVDEGAEQVPPRGYRATWELLRRLRVPPQDVPLIGAGLGTWRRGRARPGVADRAALLTGAGLGPRARLDLARFLAWTARHRRALDGDRPEATPLGTATVAEFAGRYHRELHDYLLQPVCGGFFGWDTARSAAAPAVSLLASAGPAAGWRTYRDGMDLLARRLAEGLDVATGCAVRQVAGDRGGHRVRVLTADGGTVTARAAVLAVPAPAALRLHPGAPSDEEEFLSACTFRPVLKVSCLLDRPLAPRSPRPLYVLLTPQAEGEDVLSAVIVDHAKHPQRAPAGKGLLTLMAGPRTVPDLLGAGRESVVDRLTTAAERYVPGLRAAATGHFVHSFAHGLPEATPEALGRRERFMARPVRPVEYAGDWVWLRPAGEGAVRSGALAASRVLAQLRSRARTAGRAALPPPAPPAAPSAAPAVPEGRAAGPEPAPLAERRTS